MAAIEYCWHCLKEAVVHTQPTAKVLLYCHGENYPISARLQTQINEACAYANLAVPLHYDSININPVHRPTIMAVDKALPKEHWGQFNVVLSVNCDYTGYATSPEDCESYTKPLYTSMIQALSPTHWCLGVHVEIPGEGHTAMGTGPNPLQTYESRFKTHYDFTRTCLAKGLRTKYHPCIVNYDDLYYVTPQNTFHRPAASDFRAWSALRARFYHACAGSAAPPGLFSRPEAKRQHILCSTILL
jgi:hypothetical protein